MVYKSPERKRLEAEQSYHRKCAEQYRDAAASVPMSDRMKQCALANAEFHDKQLARVVAALAKVRT